MRPGLQRLSSGPTIPELMHAELRAWVPLAAGRLLGLAWHRPVLRARLAAMLALAAFALRAARVLLQLRLITPEFAASAFRAASGLARTALLCRAAAHRQRCRPGPPGTGDRR